MHNMTFGLQIFCAFQQSSVVCIRHGKKGVTQCNEMTIVTDSFVPLHALLFRLRIEVVDARFILNNKL